MSNGSKYVASLDIGSSKICCILATKDEHEISQIIGLGYNAAKGISNGVISDFTLATKSISSAISEAEKQANIKINKINISASSKIVTTKLFSKKIKILDDRIKEDNINESLNLVMNDPYFEDSVSRWLIHIELAANKTFATMWYWLFNEYGVRDFDSGKILWRKPPWHQMAFLVVLEYQNCTVGCYEAILLDAELFTY